MDKDKDESLFRNSDMRWDICPHFHGMTDTGYGKGLSGFLGHERTRASATRS